ncbi:hypothetical protein IE81DRAFT_321574 [Ceraceosorus guamensis]|uniref:Succinate dehydrogenase [ubiquinone] cytochrome b small subunit n=1 Tax=Ceraceosorus guamensis TaxID=1522189 RepID=A0A316W612_9BASI|nr:hypothetical protein IE81DRAFT_321574 [Ceraceosorus guamensis]PWN44171.1 hypothetical protein IE81DRAFT_321574 [Ceraceosorus guamensis]
MAFSQTSLKLSMLGSNPQLRMMASGARAFSSGRAVATSSTKPTQAQAVQPNAATSYIKGTVNDPTPYPPPAPSHGSYHWLFERGLSVALLPIVAAGMVKHGSSGLLDGALAVSLIVHSHIGFDCIIADYLHKRKFPVIGPTVSWTLRAATVASLVGLYELNTNDIGLSEFIARAWVA